MMCPYRTKGCSFQGGEEEIADHVEYMVRIGDEDHMTEFLYKKPTVAVSSHWIWTMNLNAEIFEANEDDSNETLAAKGLIRLYAEIDGIAHEMSDRDITLANEFMPAVESAAEALRARDLL